jgi:GNAT superfamily N-acetyltransferase
MTRPFSDGDLDSAAALLAARHARHREAEPLLPAEVDFRAEVEALWRRPSASGAVSETGFLIGAPRENPVWGPNVWVELAGQAVEEPEAARDLYALAAQRWIDDGLTRQYVLVPSHDPALLDAWFRLSFGQQHAMGIREVPKHVEWPEGVHEATEDDLETLIALDPLLPDHQALSPVFGRGPQETEEELRRELLEGLASPHSVDLLAEVDGEIVGGFHVTTVEKSAMHAGLARPQGAAYLAWAATRPEVRGTGAGLRLTQATFAWARSRGHEVMVTDWRVTNLLSSRFWPARGFRASFLRLYRSIP